jgi:hypothetical protein
MATNLGPKALITQKVASHVSVSIQYQGKDIGSGRAQSFTADADYGLQPVHGVGDYFAAEFAPLRFDGTITMDTYRIRLQDLVDLGIAALGEKILELGVFDIVLFDTIAKKAYRTFRNVQTGRHSESIREGAICGENATFKYTEAE